MSKKIKCHYSRRCQNQGQGMICNFKSNCTFQDALKDRKPSLNISISPEIRTKLVDQVYNLYLLNNKSRFADNEAFKEGIGAGIDEFIEILASQQINIRPKE
ncbi:MAG: hypothetical protein ACERIH_03355 [Labilibaculum antarcticum]